VERVLRARPNVQRCVDLGAGSGLLGTYLRQRQPEVSYNYSEKSQFLADLLAVGFPSSCIKVQTETFSRSDLLTLLDVLEHIENDEDFLKDLASRCQVGTPLIITVPAGPKAYSEWDQILGHFRRYKMSELRDLVDDAGFRIVAAKHLFPELLPLLWARVGLRYLKTGRREVTDARGPSSDGDFPRLISWLDQSLYVLSRAIASFSSFLPMGSSLLIVAERGEVPKRPDSTRKFVEVDLGD